MLPRYSLGGKLNDGPLANNACWGCARFVDYDSDEIWICVGTEAGDLQFYRNKAIEEN